MAGNSNEPEMINVWELMKGLDDDEHSPRAKQFPKAPLPKKKTLSVMASAELPSDSFTLEPADVKDMPQWSSTVPMHSGVGRSAVNPSDSSIGDSSTARSRGGSVGGSSLHTSEHFGDKRSMSPHDSLAEQLQKSLSFEASPKKEMESIFGQKDDFDARRGKGLKMGDSSSFSSSWLLESDAALSFSGPSFSAVNLKRWFRDDKRTTKSQQDLKAASKGSVNETRLPPQAASPPRLRAATKITGSSMKATVGSSNQEGGVRPLSTNQDVCYPTPSTVGQNKIEKVSQAGGARRHRHSFTSGNRDPQFIQDRSPLPVNRHSSWELEKVAVDPKLKVVFYSTSSQTDVHAYEDSNAVRAILMSLVGASFDEKSISQYPEFEQELRNALNTPTALVPAVCVRGRYIAGVDNIMQLYKKGVLGSLLLETPAHKPNVPCICRGGKFLICPVCKGKRRLTRQGEESVLCRHCSGTGLIKCPSCLSS